MKTNTKEPGSEPEFWQCEHMLGTKGASCPMCRDKECLCHCHAGGNYKDCKSHEVLNCEHCNEEAKLLKDT